MKLGSTWKHIFHQLNSRGSVKLTVDGLPLRVTSYYDGDVVRVEVPVGIQRIPCEKARVLHQNEVGRAWLGYLPRGEVRLVYEGVYDCEDFPRFEHRLAWFLALMEKIKRSLFEEGVAPL